MIAGFVSPELSVRDEWPAVEVGELGARPGWPPIQSMRLANAWGRYKSTANILVYSGTYTPMAAQNHTHSRNILYCHTPPRFIYDQKAFYCGTLPPWQRPVFLALVGYLRRRYEAGVIRMERIVVNSENVQRRVAHYLDRESVVVPPPCDVERYMWGQSAGYYLSTARLDPLKRVDLIVRAFLSIPSERLIVVSDGVERRRLEALAGSAPNIEFTGEVDDERLRALISRCIATVYIPRDEDFGMSPVESMAAGKPVIGVAEGGLLETVLDGETGVLLPPNPGTSNLCSAVEDLTPARAEMMRVACQEQARQFRTERFLARMSRVVGE